jgi:glutaredoxin
MSKVKIFSQEKCPTYKDAQEYMKLLDRESIPFEYYNVGTPDGLAEAAYHNILGSCGIITPSVVIVNNEGRETASWKGMLPVLNELRNNLK